MFLLHSCIVILIELSVAFILMYMFCLHSCIVDLVSMYMFFLHSCIVILIGLSSFYNSLIIFHEINEDC